MGSSSVMPWTTPSVATLPYPKSTNPRSTPCEQTSATCGPLQRLTPLADSQPPAKFQRSTNEFVSVAKSHIGVGDARWLVDPSGSGAEPEILLSNAARPTCWPSV